jgi:hypothetical protein
MALYSSLTPEEQSLLAAWERNMRGWLNGLSRMVVEARALEAALNASGGPAEILALLDPTEIVPNSSGIAGAQDLARSEWDVMVTAGLNDFLLNYDTTAVRRVLAKANGPTAGL